MIEFLSENNFVLENPDKVSKWIKSIIESEGYSLGELSYTFCDDDFLHKINVEYLNHDTLTDIISFDYTMGKEIHGEIYISTERVEDNAKDYKVSFENELLRVLIHGVLHFLGYKDKTTTDEAEMRQKEDECIGLYLKGV